MCPSMYLPATRSVHVPASAPPFTRHRRSLASEDASPSMYPAVRPAVHTFMCTRYPPVVLHPLFSFPIPSFSSPRSRVHPFTRPGRRRRSRA